MREGNEGGGWGGRRKRTVMGIGDLRYECGTTIKWMTRLVVSIARLLTSLVPCCRPWAMFAYHDAGQGCGCVGVDRIT